MPCSCWACWHLSHLWLALPSSATTQASSPFMLFHSSFLDHFQSAGNLTQKSPGNIMLLTTLSCIPNSQGSGQREMFTKASLLSNLRTVLTKSSHHSLLPPLNITLLFFLIKSNHWNLSTPVTALFHRQLPKWTYKTKYFNVVFLNALSPSSLSNKTPNICIPHSCYFGLSHRII